MLNLSYQFDRQSLDEASKHARAYPKLLQKALKRQESRLRTRFYKLVKVNVPPPNYPIKWKSRKQQRAFFATDGFGHGIPYERTGALNKAWNARFTFDDSGGAFFMENTSPTARYVIGEDQQPFHADRWLYAPDVIDDFAGVVLDVYQETVRTIEDPFAGVRS